MDEQFMCFLITTLLLTLLKLTLQQNNSPFKSVYDNSVGTNHSKSSTFVIDQALGNSSNELFSFDMKKSSKSSPTRESSSSNSSENAINSTTSRKICQNIDVRNKASNLEVLRGCQVVEGFVQIVLIEFANETDFDNYSFPELREVSQFVLFYRVSGLRSLGLLFPSLTLVRGSVAIQDYALIVYEMMHLQEVGLTSLAEVSRGAVRIEKNPSLCFVNTINWDLIAKWDSAKNYVRNNKSPADCPGHFVCQEAGCPLGLCWSGTQCQIQSDEAQDDCDAECMGGCSGPGPKACHACRNYLTFDMECVNTCPNGTYIHLNHRCVTVDQCLSLINYQSEVSDHTHFVVFNGSCVQSCPPGYDYTVDRRGCEMCENGKCRKVCSGLKVDNLAAAETLQGCNIISGSLEIMISQGKHKMLAEKLEENLGSIQEIKGYLKIVRCYPLVSLSFFKELETIHGEGVLENGKYSLIVLENQNLQELWNITSNFKILNGRIFFHYNPKLCFYYIENLIYTINLTTVDNFEVSKESNGDKFPCNATDIELEFERITSNSVLINITIPNPANHNILGRYVLYYTETVGKNLDPYEEVGGCGDDNWKVRDVLIDSDRVDQQASTLQPFLKPFTRYAFYVKTYTTQSTGGLSPIYYIQTLPSRPSDVVITAYYSNTSSTIVLEWEPPRNHNGILTEYLVSGFQKQDNRNILDERDYCMYPLEESTIETLLPDFQTNIEYENKTCCPKNKIIYRPYSEFVRLCENFEGPLLIDEDDQKPISSCEKYFYKYANESTLLMQDNKTNERYINLLNNNETQIKEEDKSGHGQKNTTLVFGSLTRRSKRSKVKYQTEFYLIAKSDTKTFVISNLHHFSRYVIFVRACRKIHKNEKHNDFDNRCSKSEIVTIRTLEHPQADLIDEDQVVVAILEENNNQTLEINWEEPIDPNGAIISFEIEYRRSDLESAPVTMHCLTYLQYSKNGKKFTIQSLTQGAYNFRLRAVSLAGVGPFTRPFYFEITNPTKRTLFRIFIFTIIIIMFVTASFSAYLYSLHQRRQYFSDLDDLLPSVNNERSLQSEEDSWEVEKKTVQISKELGLGLHGKVYEGIILPLKLSCTMKEISDRKMYKDIKFLNEIKMLKQSAGIHHIVQLLGVISHSDPVLIIVESMLLGDLKSFLRYHRNVPISDFRFFKMASQIADAMFFLERNNIIHRDLATRSCMVHKELTIKLGDFGWNRDVYLADYYKNSKGELLPVRWMAPESLQESVYTRWSDVWSYGVVLWEIATMAEQPYRGLSDEQVLRWVTGGQLLHSPVFCPHKLKTIMELCWNRAPNHRPTFQQILSQLESNTDDEFKCVSYYHKIIAKSTDLSSGDPRLSL